MWRHNANDTMYPQTTATAAANRRHNGDGFARAPLSGFLAPFQTRCKDLHRAAAAGGLDHDRQRCFAAGPIQDGRFCRDQVAALAFPALLGEFLGEINGQRLDFGRALERHLFDEIFVLHVSGIFRERQIRALSAATAGLGVGGVEGAADFFAAGGDLDTAGLGAWPVTGAANLMSTSHF